MTNIDYKKRFKYLIKGKYVYKNLSVEEAKKRLKETDPGIDVSEILRVINSDRKDKFKIIFIEIISTPDFLAYYMPVIKSFLKLFIK